MAVQIKIQLECDLKSAFDCMSKTVQEYAHWSYLPNEICNSIYCSIAKRAGGDGFSSQKEFIFNFIKQDENTTLMYITGDTLSTTIPTNGTVIVVMGKILDKFKNNLIAMRGQQTNNNQQFVPPVN